MDKFLLKHINVRGRDGSQHHATGESSIEMSPLGNLSDTNHNVGKWAISTTINQQSKVCVWKLIKKNTMFRTKPLKKGQISANQD